jgi:DNA-binding NtrC family response regulator
VAERDSRRILVVDDEVSLLVVIEQYLRRLGHNVVACRSGQAALEAFERDPASYRMVLADMTLPEMSGAELLSRLLGLNPEICILVCSGYPFDATVLPASHQDRIGFLQKPFTPRMLAEAIAALEATQTGTPPA